MNHMDKFIDKWVSPFYLNILHGNFSTKCLSKDERITFNQNVHEALTRITPEIASRLISGHWREAITGSWFAGLKGFIDCREQIGERLLASKMCYAGQAHAFAMACFADENSAVFLERYLKKYLCQKDCCYDQHWAMPALIWIDQKLSTNRSEVFLAPGGLWELFTSDKVSNENDSWYIENCKKDFWEVMNYCIDNFMA